MSALSRPLDPGKLESGKTALVLIDLQKGIVSRDTKPYAATDVVTRARELAARFRAAGAPVFLVHVGWSADFGDAPLQPVSEPTPFPAGGPLPDFAAFVEGLRQDSDFTIKKRQWGAFHATELDLQLRRRGIDTIVLAGIATNIGVESTARQAWEHGYRQVIVEDVCTTFGEEMQLFAFSVILPRLGIIAKLDQVKFDK